MKTTRSPIACLSLLAVFLCIPLHAAPHPVLSVSPAGIKIGTEATGDFTVPAPLLMMRADDYKGQKPAVTIENETTLLAKYPAGAELRISVQSNTIHYAWSELPEEAFAFRFAMLLPITLANGGTFVLGDKPPTSFPSIKEKQTIANGRAQSFRLKNVTGAGIALATPDAFQEVQDNRVFNWETFVHILTYRFDENSDETSFSIVVTSA